MFSSGNGNRPRRRGSIDTDASQHDGRYYPRAVELGSAGRGMFSGWLPAAVAVQAPSSAEDSETPEAASAASQTGNSGGFLPTASAAAATAATAPAGNGQQLPPPSSSSLPPHPAEGPAPGAAAWRDAAEPSDAGEQGNGTRVSVAVGYGCLFVCWLSRSLTVQQPEEGERAGGGRGGGQLAGVGLWPLGLVRRDTDNFY